MTPLFFAPSPPVRVRRHISGGWLRNRGMHMHYNLCTQNGGRHGSHTNERAWSSLLQPCLRKGRWRGASFGDGDGDGDGENWPSHSSSRTPSALILLPEQEQGTRTGGCQTKRDCTETTRGRGGDTKRARAKEVSSIRNSKPGWLHALCTCYLPIFSTVVTQNQRQKKYSEGEQAKRSKELEFLSCSVVKSLRR